MDKQDSDQSCIQREFMEFVQDSAERSDASLLEILGTMLGLTVGVVTHLYGRDAALELLSAATEGVAEIENDPDADILVRLPEGRA